MFEGRVSVAAGKDDFAGKRLVAQSHPFYKVGAVFERVQLQVDRTFTHFAARPAPVVYSLAKGVGAPDKAVHLAL
jgi:hypothetical protein